MTFFLRCAKIIIEKGQSASNGLPIECSYKVTATFWSEERLLCVFGKYYQNSHCYKRYLKHFTNHIFYSTIPPFFIAWDWQPALFTPTVNMVTDGSTVRLLNRFLSYAPSADLHRLFYFNIIFPKIQFHLYYFFFTLKEGKCPLLVNSYPKQTVTFPRRAVSRMSLPHSGTA